MELYIWKHDMANIKHSLVTNKIFITFYISHTNYFNSKTIWSSHLKVQKLRVLVNNKAAWFSYGSLILLKIFCFCFFNVCVFIFLFGHVISAVGSLVETESFKHSPVKSLSQVSQFVVLELLIVIIN